MGNLDGIAVMIFLGVGAVFGLFLAAIVLLVGAWVAIPAWLPWSVVAACTAAGGIAGYIAEQRG